MSTASLPQSLSSPSSTAPTVLWRPNPGPQTQALRSTAAEILYGGAAGGGKSAWLIALNLRWVQNPTFSGLVLRRDTPQLADLIEKSFGLYSKLGARLNQTTGLWRFPSGARVWFTHCQHETDVSRFDGHEFQVVCFDELTHFTERQYTQIRARIRGTDPTLPRWTRATTNPGGPGHDWVFKRWGAWLDPKAARRAAPGEPLWFVGDELAERGARDALQPAAAGGGAFVVRVTPPRQAMAKTEHEVWSELNAAWERGLNAFVRERVPGFKHKVTALGPSDVCVDASTKVDVLMRAMARSQPAESLTTRFSLKPGPSERPHERSRLQLWTFRVEVVDADGWLVDELRMERLVKVPRSVGSPPLDAMFCAMCADHRADERREPSLPRGVGHHLVDEHAVELLELREHVRRRVDERLRRAVELRLPPLAHAGAEA
jgi:hypothetical protein